MNLNELMTMSNTQLLKVHKKDLVRMIRDIKSVYNKTKYDTSDIDVLSVRLYESEQKCTKLESVCKKKDVIIESKVADALGWKKDFRKEEVKTVQLSREVNNLQNEKRDLCKCTWLSKLFK